MNDHDLEAELRALGRTVTVEPVPDDLADRVLARIPARRPHPVRRFLRRTVLDARARRRLIAVIIAALIVGLLITPPVRAAVIEWLQVGGIVFRSAPAPVPPQSSVQSPTRSPSPPRIGGPIMIEVADIDRARSMIKFPIGLPTGLGRPSRVAVSEDRRLVEVEFSTGTGRILLSQFEGTMAMFIKRSWDKLIKVDVAGSTGVWLPGPHTISYVDAEGVEHTDQARIAGPTLAYETRPNGAAHPITVRLEGDFDRQRAIDIAESITWPE